jgi:hypothetical protein
MSVREGDNVCGSRDNSCIRRGLQEEAFTAMAEEKPGGEAAEESRGGAVGEEGWTAGAAEEEDVCGGCSIEEGGAVRKVG